MTKRVNARGCLAALVVGFVLGAFRLAVDTPVSMGMEGFEAGYDPGSFLWIVNNIYFQYYSLFIFTVSVVVMVAVSYLTEPPSYERISGLTYATVTDEHPCAVAHELGPAGRAGVHPGPDHDPHGLPVLPRLTACGGTPVSGEAQLP